MTKLYQTWTLASKAARALKIRTATEYFSRRSEDLSLPSNPNRYYGEKWEENGGWYGFLKKKDPGNMQLLQRLALLLEK